LNPRSKANAIYLETTSFLNVLNDIVEARE